MPTFSSIAAAITLAATAAQASPIGLPDVLNLVHPTGFDASLIGSKVFSGIAPVFHTLSAADLLQFGNITSVPANVPADTTLEQRYITGTDDRYQYTNPNAFPWRSVGRLNWSNGVICSAALIGTKHILTAGHCKVNDGKSSAQFCPSFDNGPNPSFGCANIVAGLGYTTDPTASNCNVQNDWQVMILDKTYGSGLGYFGAEVANTGGFNQAIFATDGYPGDRDGANRPYRQDNQVVPSNPPAQTQFPCTSSGPFFTTTDSAGGQSGSSFWKNNYNVWGVLSISYQSGNTGGTGFASGQDMCNGIAYARSNYT